jgi:hypothetical protein
MDLDTTNYRNAHGCEPEMDTYAAWTLIGTDDDGGIVYFGGSGTLRQLFQGAQEDRPSVLAWTVAS